MNRIAVVSAATRVELLAAIDRALADPRAFSAAPAALAPLRLAIVAEDAADFAAKLARAKDRLVDPECRRIREARGIYFSSEPLAQRSMLAFVFPGEGAQYANMLADLPEAAELFAALDRAFAGHRRGFLPSAAITGGELLHRPDVAIEVVLAANQALYSVLRRLRLEPTAIVGHSTGEYSAIAAGLMPEDRRDAWLDILRALGRFDAERSGAISLPEVVVTSVSGVGYPRLARLLAESRGALHLALDNCENQTIICGDPRAIDRARDELVPEGALFQTLPFARPHHTPLFATAMPHLERALSELKLERPRARVYSCATAAVFPDEVEAIRALLLSQWTRTVRFRETIEAMYRDGIRTFVEVGPRGNLSAAIATTLRGKPHLAIATNLEHRSGSFQLRSAIAELIANGADLDLRGLQPIDDRAPAREPDPPRRDPRAAALEAHFELMRSFLQTQRTVMTAYFERARGEGRPLVPGRRASVRRCFSLERDPILRDHTFGRNVSRDLALTGLPVVPFTFVLDLLVEAAARLESGRALIGVRNFRQSRWLTLTEPRTVEASASLLGEGVVQVSLQEVEVSPPRPIAEVEVLFAAAAAQAPAAEPFVLVEDHPSRWSAGDLYTRGMFHGPAFRGMRSIDRAAAAGSVSVLEVLPHPQPRAASMLDPLLLDFAGQAVAFWALEHGGTGRAWFPHHLEALDWYPPAPRPGERVECRVRAAWLGERGLRASLELVAPGGRVVCRARGWEDRAFDEPAAFRALRFQPNTTFLSRSIAAGERVERRAIDSELCPFLESAQGIWLEVLAWQILGRAERTEWLRFPNRGPAELLARCVAKDAVRALLLRTRDLELLPADVELVVAGDGSFRAPDAPEVRGRIDRQGELVFAEAESINSGGT